MGVMSCGRSGCDNIMCHDYLDDFGIYICHECLSELRELLEDHPMTSREVQDFIDSKKDAKKIYSSISDLIGE